MTVHYAIEDHIAVLTLCDPPRRNALSRAIVRDMLAQLARARHERARGVVVAAQGKVFCSGANMDDLRDGWMDGHEEDTDPVRMFQALTEMPVPVIAAVQGPALGGGFELTMCCDLVVASDAAWFALPELGVGVIPNTAAALLPPLVGTRQALEIMLGRERIAAAQAHALHLVNAVVPAGDELRSAVAWAAKIAAGTTPSAVQVARRALRRHHPVDWEAVRRSLHEVDRAEWEEGLSAFTARRPFDHQKFWAGTGAAAGG
ncbi:enoyl-CoA hydratase/isomerase family protein [Xenophilus azovorans]|uniref:enoyl-CoA hydratase/isomerase family protein n=1 Tax=Xenophilus azovorans TaxID=151755 RepID=UPI000571F492|nr:enoyl-CoA hydratase/isomerase family protein [Xenophilus azovorans]